jgi:hypothetical protein
LNASELSAPCLVRVSFEHPSRCCSAFPVCRPPGPRISAPSAVQRRACSDAGVVLTRRCSSWSIRCGRSTVVTCHGAGYRLRIAIDTAVLRAGDSAGGNLAAAVTNRLSSEGFRLSAQLLIYPATDMASNSVGGWAWRHLRDRLFRRRPLALATQRAGIPTILCDGPFHQHTPDPLVHLPERAQRGGQADGPGLLPHPCPARCPVTGAADVYPAGEPGPTPR